MSRPSLLVLAASLAAVAVGCAHCDTCDDFPAPCTGPNCGFPYQSSFPIDGGMHVEPIVGGPVGMPAGQIPPGAILADPAYAPTAPTIVPPRPTPADDGAAAGASPAPSSPPASSSPPAGMPAPGSDNAAPGGAADPLDIPLPGDNSPFGGPIPN